MRDGVGQCPLPLGGRGWREAAGEGRDARKRASALSVALVQHVGEARTARRRDQQVIAFEPERMLLFSWNAPPKFGPLRNEHTYVLLRFDDARGGGTRVRLTHFGWREAAEWNPIYDYFDDAWTRVMAKFAKDY